GLARPQEYSAYGALHRACAGQVQEFLAGLSFQSCAARHRACECLQSNSLRTPGELVEMFERRRFADSPRLPLVSVRKHIESLESVVSERWWPDSGEGHRCGRRRIANVTTAAGCDIRVI